jgi:hypothetical protein
MEVDARSASTESQASTSCHSSGYSFNLLGLLLFYCKLYSKFETHSQRKKRKLAQRSYKKKHIYRQNNQNTNTATTTTVLTQIQRTKRLKLNKPKFQLRSNFHENATTLDGVGLF